MKYILYLLATMYIIWWITFIKFFVIEKKIDDTINIEKIKKSIVIIMPENKIIDFKNNPKWLFEEYKESWIWAWFFINASWTIQTVNHIIENDNIDYKIIYNNKEYKSKVISRDKEKDLAIIKIINIAKEKYNYLKIEKNINIWEKLFSFWVDTKNLKIIYNTWILISKKSKLENTSNLLEISNTLKSGFSWWPIINSKWKVIWINYATSEWKNYWINY